MRRLFPAFLLAALAISPATAAVVLTNGSTYTQAFDSQSGSDGGVTSLLPTGWVSSETGTNANALITFGTGSNNAGDTYLFGATNSSERALGGLQSGALTPLFGVVFTNNTGRTITALDIGYTGEQWRLGAVNRVDRLDFQYALNTQFINVGSFTDVNALDFTSPGTTGATGQRNGNLAANRVALNSTISGLSIANGQSFALRWSDFNASGADDGLGVDDFSLTPTLLPQVGAVPEPSTWAMMIAGFGLIGGAMRRRTGRVVAA